MIITISEKDTYRIAWVSPDISHKENSLNRIGYLVTNNTLRTSVNQIIILIVINAVIGGFRWQDLKWLAYETVRLQVSDYSQLSDYTVRLQFCRLINAKYSSLCTNHIWGNCNGYDYAENEINISKVESNLNSKAITSVSDQKWDVLKPLYLLSFVTIQTGNTVN